MKTEFRPERTGSSLSEEGRNDPPQNDSCSAVPPRLRSGAGRRRHHSSPSSLLRLVREAKAQLAKCGAQGTAAVLDKMERVLERRRSSKGRNHKAASKSRGHPLRDGLRDALRKVGYSAAKAAKALGLKPRQLREACRADHSCTCRELVCRVRMQAAAELLLQGVSVKEVAAHVGYISPASFSRAFIHFYGVSPWEYVHDRAYHSPGDREPGRSAAR